MAAPDQESLLRGLSGFSFEGRASARTRDESSPPVTLSWDQQADQSRVQVSGALGMGGLTLTYSAGSLQVEGGDGQSYRGEEAEQILAAQVGFVPPFEALRYWVLGLAAPGEQVADQQPDATGRIAAMTQQGWRIQYERWNPEATRAGAVQLPQRLTATRGDVRLLLVVKSWKLQGAD